MPLSEEINPEAVTSVTESDEPLPPPPPARVRERLDDLANDYAVKRSLVEMLKDDLKVPQAQQDEAEALLFDAMEQLGLRMFRHETLGSFGLSDLASAKVEDPAAFVAWAKDQMPEILKPEYNRLSKLVRDHLKGDFDFPGATDLPPGVDFVTRRGIRWTRPR